MSLETELRELLESASSGIGSRVDARTVVRRSRRRRLGSQVAVGGASTLAVAGIGVASVVGIQSFRSVSMAGSASDSIAGVREPDMGSSGQGASKRAPAEKINLCGGPLAEVAPSETGLVLTTKFPATSPADGAPVIGTVTLTNTGTKPLKGTTAASPAITLSQDGTVLWHSNGAMIMMAAQVDLAPGASMEYQATFTPVRCSVDDDQAESFREDLPALGAGAYQVSAAIDFLDEDGSGGAANDLVTGPRQDVTLG